MSPNQKLEDESVSLAKVLSQLRERKVSHPDSFEAGATDEEIEAANARLASPIPRMWQEVLKVSNGFYLGGIYFGWTVAINPIENDNRPALVKRAPAGSLWIGNYASGDVVVLDVARQAQDGDCPVVWVSHESSEAANGQPIPTFLQDWIEVDKRDDDRDDEENGSVDEE